MANEFNIFRGPGRLLSRPQFTLLETVATVLPEKIDIQK